VEVESGAEGEGLGESEEIELDGTWKLEDNNGSEDNKELSSEQKRI
jgi:hypothetical protein